MQPKTILYGVGGHKADNYGGHPAPAGRALPNLINAVSILKSKPRACFDFDFNILTAFIRLGRAGPVGAGCPPYSYYLTFILTFIITIIKKEKNILWATSKLS
jgi:hypothetical protein